MRERLELFVAILVLAAFGSTGGAVARQPIEEGPRSGVAPHSPENQGTSAAARTELEFIDTGFENASPVWYETAPDGVTQVYPSGRRWQEYGAQLCRVLFEYFDTVKP
jgi:hypothetical protein